ncbi:MAG TPA: hypothetical protein VHI78_02650, partial [Bacteroidales bacterium]|nr:hypothetical protein [Bacteroidales bacterium]
MRWIWLPLIFVSMLIFTIMQTNIALAVHNIVLNSTFFLLQLLFVLVYFYFKNKSIRNFTTEIMGWGDILFLLAITPLFEFIIYLS